MEWCRQFWDQVARPAMERELPELYAVTAVGLIGNGSECFGFDDELSQDHDWGTDLYLWVPAAYMDQIPMLEQWKGRLLDAHPEYPQRVRSTHGAVCKVQTVEGFYRQHMGYTGRPETMEQWLSIPEENLAMSVNGQVFHDPVGHFTEIRNALLAHYPDELWKKRLAARCMMLAQTGQYNLERCRKRGHTVAAAMTRIRFIEEAIWMVFLMNRAYRPYYKWAFPAMCRLPLLAKEIGPLLEILAKEDDQAVVDRVCALLADALRKEGLTNSRDWFLASHGEELQQSIRDPLLSRLPAQYG